MECNKEQEEAIMHRDGPAMVLAGPGARKNLCYYQSCESID